MNNATNIIFEEIPTKTAKLGIITLNRPNTLNALNLEMIVAIYQQLKNWEQDNAIKAIIIKSNSTKAFCAGGDLKQLYAAKPGNIQSKNQFFWQEYRLNYYIKNYSKPYIALLDGIAMGGGAGISIHGSHKIATENFIFAMPETGIGLFPDVGGSYFLSRCPHPFGIYLGLTGAQIQAADAAHLGIINYYIPSAKLQELIPNLSTIDLTEDCTLVITNLLKKLSEPTTAPALLNYQKVITDCFNFNTIEEIFNYLTQQTDPWQQTLLKQLLTKSPTSLKITLEQLTRGRQLSFAECLKMEYRIVTRVLANTDFYEGIRAQVIDKDKNPQWNPAIINQISANDIAEYFAPLGEEDELVL